MTHQRKKLPAKIVFSRTYVSKKASVNRMGRFREGGHVGGDFEHRRTPSSMFDVAVADTIF